MEHWCTLYTKPRKEQQVSTFLESRGFETYLPVIQVRKRGREKPVPFFSCYLFVRVDPSNGLSSLRWTPGLRRIVSFGDQPALVDERVISFIKQRLADMEGPGSTAYRFKPGDRVAITSGPLRHLEGIFNQESSSRDRGKILVDFLGRWTRCEVEIDRLEKVL